MSPRHACSRFAEVADFTASECSCQNIAADVVEAYLDDASDLLYFLSRGAVFGRCTRTVRPCRGCFCGCCLACCDIDAIPLRGPVISVDAIKIDGVVVDPATYQLLPRGRVMKVSTSDHRPEAWPSGQKLWKPDTEEDTFSITYTFGMADPFPTWVIQAALELACEMTTFTLTGESKLPANASSVFFQGLTVAMPVRTRILEQHVDQFPAVGRFLAVAGQGGGGVFTPDGIDGWTFPLS